MLIEDLESNFPDFEEETGFVSPEELEQQDFKQNQDIASDGELLKGLKQHAGWKLLEAYLTCETDALLKQLVVEDNSKIIRKLQAMISALRLLPIIVDKVLIDADKAEQAVKQYLTDEPDEELANSH